MGGGKQGDGVFFPGNSGESCLRRSLAVLLLLLVSGGLSAQYGEAAAGGRAVADRYAEWARRAMEEGRWAEAEAALERAADYADLSSELSWLLALVRLHEKRPPGTVLEALRRGIEADRWNSPSPPEEVRLLEAALLIRCRFYTEALEILSLIPEGADAALLRLRALMGLGDLPQFRSAMARSLERYPRDPRHAGLLFKFAGNLLPGEAGRESMDTVLRRLPILLEEDPDLAWKAVPFIGDTGEARRLVGAYRAGGGGSPEAVPAALRLGLIGEPQAMEELFSVSGASPVEASLGGGPWRGAVPGRAVLLSGVFSFGVAGPDLPGGSPVLDKALILSVWELLRNTAAREEFRRNLLGFSGVITEDRDGDGFPESEARYEDGLVRRYVYDEGQDGLPELTVFFNGGLPFRGETAVFPEAGEGGQERALVFWEQYPAVLRVELGDRRYFPKPLDFF
ncbi:MAG: hypothetical protein LBP43_01570, partial [Treponema sp.]|nr:hypothetical protein [Treponema sp.]